MSPAAASRLNERLRAYEAATQHQLLVWIGKTTDGVPIEDFAARAFESWKVGRKGIDDGAVLFILSSDRKLRFEVGYGLEPTVPDIVAGRVINGVIVPRIRSGDNDGAVTAGMEALATAIGGPPLPGGRAPPQSPVSRSPAYSLGQLVFLGMIGVVILLFLLRNPSLAFLLMSGSSGRSYRRGGWSSGGGWSGGGWGGAGWGGGGGGWSGGGGRSGGGGASGSW